MENQAHILTLVKKLIIKIFIEIVDIVRISKYKNIFAKGYVPNWSEEVFVIKKIKNTLQWTYFIKESYFGKIVGTFYKKELQKENQKELRVEKAIKRKSDKRYVKWKGYDSSFNSWIDKKRYSLSEYFPESKSLGEGMKVELDFSNIQHKQI